MKAQSEVKADKWEVIEFPAILPNDEPVWPEYWSKEDLDECQSFNLHKELERTIHAGPNLRRRCNYKT